MTGQRKDGGSDKCERVVFSRNVNQADRPIACGNRKPGARASGFAIMQVCSDAEHRHGNRHPQDLRVSMDALSLSRQVVCRVFGARTMADAGYASMDYCACQITQYGSLVEPMSVPR